MALLAKLILVYFDGGLLLVIRCYSCDGWETKSTPSPTDLDCAVKNASSLMKWSLALAHPAF